jgi:hypothetical protein
MKLSSHSVIDRLNVCLGTVHAHVLEDSHSQSHEQDNHVNSDHSHDQPNLHAHHCHPLFKKVVNTTTESAISTLVDTSSRLIELWKSAPSSAVSKGVSSVISELLLQINKFKDADVLSILSDPEIGRIQPQLWDILSTVECQNELREAITFCEREALSLDQVLQYSFGGDYERLVGKKIECMLESFPNLRDQITGGHVDFKFVGAGPMPMSAIFMNKMLKCKIECIDRDAKAAIAGRTLIEKLGLAESLPYSCDVSNEMEILPHQVLFVASLVQGKLDALSKVPVDVRAPLFVQNKIFEVKCTGMVWLLFVLRMVYSVCCMSRLIEWKSSALGFMKLVATHLMHARSTARTFIVAQRL